ncbi:MAG TPA: hypothetical protein VFS43_08795 [Polyangiaceae bacterium]|nr:hypothetical protein [Polyangiaceae bacterium]
MAERVDARERFEGPGPSRDESPDEGFAFGARADRGGATTEAWSSAPKSTVQRATRPANDEGEGAWLRPSTPPEATCALLSSAFARDNAPPCVRRAEAGARWSELRHARGEAAAVTREALAAIDRLEGLLARLASSSNGGPSVYQLRLAEGLVRSLRDVLAEFGDEADLATRGAWTLLLLG